MKTWDDYKKHVKTIDKSTYGDIKEAEELALIINAIIDKRKKLGLSQRDLAKMCNLPQSSIARIESCKTIPNLGTILNIFNNLGLSFKIE